MLLVLGYFALMQYFNSTLVPLGADLYGYSWKDIQQTVGASGGLNVITIVLMLAVVFSVFAVDKWLTKKLTPGLKEAYLVGSSILVIALLSTNLLNIQPSFEKEYDNNIAKNKISYFISASVDHFFPTHQDVDIYADNYVDNSFSSFNYLDEKKFPFLHADSVSDVLSPFLKSSQTPPNIVIILVEGLGRAFTNEGAYLGNFTPFLDSLSKQSLYWQNLLSGGGRTFAVLPTVTGSLPFGKNGFNETKDNMQKHLSLLSVLKKNGYSTSFFYAGDASFDNMGFYMQQQGIDGIYDKGTFPAGYDLLPANNGFTWGYGDKELFRYFLNKQQPAVKPSVQVMLTVSTHSPFLIPDQSYYDQAFEKRMTALNFNDDQKKEHRTYQKQYTTILYADDALKNFFKEYSKRPDYNNTIFLITGDHRMPEIPMATKIDRYHVPLILFSPMLQRTGTFQSISTHFDITPTLLAYLQKNYNVNVPWPAAWVGSGLDTTKTFQNIHATPLMQTKTDLIDFVMGTYHLNGEDLFKLNSNMGEEKADDPAMKENLRNAFTRFQQKNNEFIKGAGLIPDSLYTKYHP
ncbi:MAG: LTA synthase family protein [Chitinophagaceae bacterium]